MDPHDAQWVISHSYFHNSCISLWIFVELSLGYHNYVACSFKILFVIAVVFSMTTQVFCCCTNTMDIDNPICWISWNYNTSLPSCKFKLIFIASSLDQSLDIYCIVWIYALINKHTLYPYIWQRSPVSTLTVDSITVVQFLPVMRMVMYVYYSYNQKFLLLKHKWHSDIIAWCHWISYHRIL